MFEIEGKFNTAICYASVVEDTAVEQIRRMCDHEFTAGSKIRIMPDVHAGAGCTIGTTMTVVDKVVPNIVGVDIGCGMFTVTLGGPELELDLPRIDGAAHFIPSGRDVWEGRQEHFDLTQLRCYRELRDARRLERSLGTLGGGNHFIEVDVSAAGVKYLVIHSGSRNLGKQVAEYYQGLAVELSQGKQELFAARDALISEYKEAGRRSEIQAAIKALFREWEAKQPTVPPDLAFLYGSYLEDYLHDVEICQAFARRNRELMASVLLERCGLGALEDHERFHTIHNYIDVNEMILRKGAIAAHEGELVLIPLNMRDGSILARGKGNPEWNYSAPHGAGRIKSRAAARGSIDMQEYRDSMAGIYTTSVSEATLDESPMAYKSIGDIIDVVRDAVDVIEVLKPIYNFKAAD
ncbi:MAG: RtcB family protein [Coriobacteriales bacterium]|nr:RtcB family protein [Coriobacteriales bacterium]